MKVFLTLCLAGLMAALVGCDDDYYDDESADGRRYVPPVGLGAILVENDTFSDWNVLIDGELIGRVANGSFLVRDYPPGRHTVHLDVHLGSEEEDAVLGVAEGQLSVLRIDGDSFDYDLEAFTIVP